MADMWATVRRYEGVTDPDEVGKRVREGFVPLISSHEGFVASYLLDAGERHFLDQRFRGSSGRGGLEPPGRGFRQGESRRSVAEPTDDHGGPGGGRELADHPVPASTTSRGRSPLAPLAAISGASPAIGGNRHITGSCSPAGCRSGSALTWWTSNGTSAAAAVRAAAAVGSERPRRRSRRLCRPREPPGWWSWQ